MSAWQDWQQRSDEELMARLQKGQKEALGELVHRYEKELYGYLRRLVGDPTLAEDIFQSTFLQLYQKADQYEPGRAVRPWLYTLATNLAIDAMRRAGRRQAVSLDRLHEQGEEQNAGSLLQLLAAQDKEPFQNLEAKERAELVQRALLELPEPMRTVVLLAYYRGLKYNEIAEILGIPLGTVKSRLHMALRRLYELLRQKLEPESMQDKSSETASHQERGHHD